MPGLLALLAHPDDEFFCSGLLCAAQARQIPVHLAYWTRGEGGGSPRSRAIWRGLPRAWHPRVREAKKAAALLSAASLTFLGAIDPIPDPHWKAPSDDEASVIAKMGEVWSLHSPELLVTHGSNGEYGHPAHQRLHRIAGAFVAAQSDCPLVSFAAVLPPFGAAFLNADDVADFVLDTELYRNEKRRLLLAHRSQKGVLASLPGAGGSVESLLQASRYEGYRCWNQKEAALEKLCRWTQIESSFGS